MVGSFQQGNELCSSISWPAKQLQSFSRPWAEYRSALEVYVSVSVCVCVCERAAVARDIYFEPNFFTGL
jgi:hypothetical protein